MGGVNLSRSPFEAPAPFSSVMPTKLKTVEEYSLVDSLAVDFKLSEVFTVAEVVFMSDELE